MSVVFAYTDKAHPNKPRSVLCTLHALTRWTGWSERRVDYLVAEGKLKTKKYSENGWRNFYVESAQKLLDEGW